MQIPHTTHKQDHQHHQHNVAGGDLAERLASAKSHCLERSVRFTPLRQEIYQVIVQADRPMGAYDLLDALRHERQKNASKKQKNIAAPTIYRSLDFLREEGLIHHLNSINAYVPCCHPRDSHIAAFLICQSCKKVEECSNAPMESLVDFAAADAKFAVTASVIELMGFCHDCQK